MGRDKGQGSGVSHDRKAIHTTEAVSHVALSSHSQPFDTAFRAYSGQAVDLQEVTSEPACAGHADRPGVRFYVHAEIDSAPSSCRGYAKKSPL